MATSEISNNLKSLHREIDEQRGSRPSTRGNQVESVPDGSSTTLKDSTDSEQLRHMKASSVQTDSRAGARKVFQQFEIQAREHPVSTAIVAFGLGIVVSRLLSR